MVAPGRQMAGKAVTPERPDVLVVGAGPTGLSLALAACDHGARVRVVERREHTWRPSRALIVHPRTLEVLRPFGVCDELAASGAPAPSVRLHLGAAEIALRLGGFALEDTAFAHLLFVPQARVEAVLCRALSQRGVEIEYATEADAVEATATGALVHLERAGGRELAACRFVAGCDGATSTVRRCAGIGWPGGPYREEVVLADLELDAGPTPGVAHAVATPGGVVFLFALGERATWRLLATRSATASGDAPGQPAGTVPAADLEAILSGAGLGAGVAHVAWSARVPLEHRLATRYREGPLFLAGDAAHLHSPAGGQGMNTGIQDAVNLAWKLAFARRAEHRVGEVLLDSYGAERRPVARRVLAMTHAIFWAEAHPGGLPRLAREVLAPLLAPGLPWVLGRRHLVAAGVRLLSQLDVAYRHSALSVGESGAPPPGRSPGERLADASVEVGGKRRRLHEVLAHPGVHVLIERDAPETLLDAPAALVRVLRVTSWPGRGALVVRPDGYVGYRSALADAAAIARWPGLAALATRPGTGEA